NTDSDSVTVTAAEMDVQGLGVSILDGDSTPSLTDNTGFPTTDVNSPAVNHTFTIYNTGNVGLVLDGVPKVSINGGDGSFTVQTQTVLINNLGTTLLTLSGTPKVDITGTNAADFTVTLQPAGTVAGGGNTNFTIEFNPSGAGPRTATVSIANDDPNENPYNF